MLIVAGWLSVDTTVRDAFVDGCRSVVRQALAADGCLDFSIDRDAMDPGRVRVFERWRDETSLLAFRGSGTDDQGEAILDADVRRYEISGGGPA